jgi:hypothetical protein
MNDAEVSSDFIIEHVLIQHLKRDKAFQTWKGTTPGGRCRGPIGLTCGPLHSVVPPLGVEIFTAAACGRFLLRTAEQALPVRGGEVDAKIPVLSSPSAILWAHIKFCIIRHEQDKASRI